jgi:hypothetical protein
MSVFASGTNNAFSASSTLALSSRLDRLAHVSRAEGVVELNGAPLRNDGSPRIATLGQVFPIASVNGLFFNQDKVTVTAGRMADPRRPNEIIMPQSAANLLGFHVGQHIPFGFYTNDQETLPNFGTRLVPPAYRIDVTLVGLVALSSEIVEDDIDRFPTFIVFTPAMARALPTDPKQSVSGAETFSIRIVGGTRNVAAVERELAPLIPQFSVFAIHATAPTSAKVDRSVRPIAIALGVFGLVAFVAAMLIAAQAISRRFRESSEELNILRAIGADPSMLAADGLMGILGGIVAGSLLAALAALAVSPLAPLGPVRSVYPFRGFSVDWAVLGAGTSALIILLSSVALILAYRAAPRRAAQRARLARVGRSKIVQTVATSGLPAPAVVGVRMALESGSGRNSVPVRSALLGTALAVALVVATLVFGSSLQSLANTPALYGWNWTYMLNSVGAGSAGVPPQSMALLAHDPHVAAATGVDYLNVELDGQNVPFLFGDLNATVTPPILSGHALERKNQIVLGAGTMAQLNKRLGDTVVVSYGSPKDAPVYMPPTRLVIVGTATMPAVGFASIVSDHTSMGTGALIAFKALPPAFLPESNVPYPALGGPNLVFVRLHPGVSAAVGRADMQRIADALNRDFAELPGGAGSGDVIGVEGVQRPAEIVNYRTMGVTPALLVSGLALGAVTALALTLAASVRRRRRDLALLKTLGFLQRQLAAAVAWQASVSAAVGVVVGVPLGIILGRWLWDLFARQIYAVPEPTVPTLSLVLVGVGAIVLANIVAAIPARIAARTSTATMLRAE